MTEETAPNPLEVQASIKTKIRALDTNANPKKGSVNSKQFLDQYSFALAYPRFSVIESVAGTMVDHKGKANPNQAAVFHNNLDELMRSVDEYIAGRIPSDKEMIDLYRDATKDEYEAYRATMPNGTKPDAIKAAARTLRDRLEEIQQDANKVPELKETFEGFNNLIESKWDSKKNTGKPLTKAEEQRYETMLKDHAARLMVKVTPKEGQLESESIREAKNASAQNVGKEIRASIDRMKFILEERGLKGAITAEEMKYSGGLVDALKGIYAPEERSLHGRDVLFYYTSGVDGEGLGVFKERIDSARTSLKTLVESERVPSLMGKRAYLIGEELNYLEKFGEEAQKQIDGIVAAPEKEKKTGMASPGVDSKNNFASLVDPAAFVTLPPVDLGDTRVAAERVESSIPQLAGAVTAVTKR